MFGEYNVELDGERLFTGSFEDCCKFVDNECEKMKKENPGRMFYATGIRPGVYGKSIYETIFNAVPLDQVLELAKKKIEEAKAPQDWKQWELSWLAERPEEEISQLFNCRTEIYSNKTVYADRFLRKYCFTW